jgi:peptide/nickel transport system permease protein
MAIPTVLLVSTIVFLVFQQLADPAVIDLGPTASPEALEARRHVLGLDRPWTTRYFEHLWSSFTLDLGESNSLRAPVSEVLGDAIGPTLAYAVPGFLIASVLSLALGLRAAVRKGRVEDRALALLATLLMSTSSLIIVMLGQYVLAHRLELFPVVGWPLGHRPDAPLAPYLMLPVLLWVLIQVGPDLRHYRALLVQELRRPYVDGLRSRGLPEPVVLRHVLHNVAGPVLARIGQRLPYLLVGSVIIEQVFNVPGVGDMIFVAMGSSDLPLLQGVTLVLTLVTVGAQLVFDILAGAIDPSLRSWEGDR